MHSVLSRFPASFARSRAPFLRRDFSIGGVHFGAHWPSALGAFQRDFWPSPFHACRFYRATTAAATTGVGVVHTCVLLLFGIRRSVSKLPVHFTPKISLWAQTLSTPKCTPPMLKSFSKQLRGPVGIRGLCRHRGGEHGLRRATQRIIGRLFLPHLDLDFALEMCRLKWSKTQKHQKSPKIEG